MGKQVTYEKQVSHRIPQLSKRIYKAAELSGNPRVFADVGTDHAYLPIFMLSEGRTSTAIATDINSGPLKMAKQNAEAYGVSNRLILLKTDGLTGVERYSPDVVVIAGMGGELSAAIIEKADFLKERKTRIVMQPMTRPEILRISLCSGGFTILDECIIEDGKLYQLFTAHYTGVSDTYSDAELLVGKSEKNNDPLFEKYVTLVITRLKKVYSGLLASSEKEANKHEINRIYVTASELYSMIGMNCKF